MAYKGFFIVLEGIDGCGKTTIATLLAKRLKASVTKEPTHTSAAGKKIHAILQHKKPAPSPLEFQRLYIADRINHTKKIKAWLAKGTTVICQRYAMSTFAYGMAFGVSLADMKHDFLRPDLTILLDLPATVAMSRIKNRKKNREYFEKEVFLEKIRKQYMKLAKKYNAIVIDAEPSPKDIVDNVMDAIRRRGIY